MSMNTEIEEYVMDHNWADTWVGDYLASSDVSATVLDLINTGVFSLNVLSITITMFALLWSVRFHKEYTALVILSTLSLAAVAQWNSLYLMLQAWDPEVGESYPQVIYSHKVFYDLAIIMVSYTLISLKGKIR